mmetsp:Transcript_32810/g.60327  ORF Transcript_32810/g.60327 Transcript_32810/m.60327 type:complete len:102 (-) Transcript_32810:7-312(-)
MKRSKALLLRLLVLLLMRPRQQLEVRRQQHAQTEWRAQSAVANTPPVTDSHAYLAATPSMRNVYIGGCAARVLAACAKRRSVSGRTLLLFRPVDRLKDSHT